jgi:hypothetical protein
MASVQAVATTTAMAISGSKARFGRLGMVLVLAGREKSRSDENILVMPGLVPGIQ